mgnify:CR=1 FL=1
MSVQMLLKGKENQLFAQYAKEHPRREQAISAWNYLENIYNNDSLFQQQKESLKAIHQEKLRINKEDTQFLNKLPANSYVQWFLPIRKLVSNVSIIAQYHTEEIPATIAALRNVDYNNPRLYKSGLLKAAFVIIQIFSSRILSLVSSSSVFKSTPYPDSLIIYSLK